MERPELARLRLANQMISSHPCATPVEVVAALGGVQAQEYRSALWAVGLRLAAASEAGVERSLAEGSIVRTWAMRGTLHLLASSDVRWMLGLLAPRLIAAGAHRRRQLEIDSRTLTRSRKVVLEALSHAKSLPRSEATRALEDAGVSTAGQRGIHILRHLSLEGLLCQTTAKGAQSVFVLLDDWIPHGEPMGREAALAELARRYVCSHGPATLKDFGWWSGLTMADARRGLEAAGQELDSVRVGDETYWLARGHRPARGGRSGVYLLPAYDEYVLGYSDRSLVLDPVASERIIPGGNGFFRPTVVVDGRVAGEWKPGRGGKRSSVGDLDVKLDAKAQSALDRAVRGYDRFAGNQAAVER